MSARSLLGISHSPLLGPILLMQRWNAGFAPLQNVREEVHSFHLSSLVQ